MKPDCSKLWHGYLVATILAATVVLLETILYAFMPRSVLDQEWFSIWSRIFLVVFELSLVTLLVGGFALFLYWLARRLNPWFSLAGSILLCWILVAFFMTSWTLYFGTGSFLGIDGLEMWWQNLGQMSLVVAHIVPWLSFAIPLASLFLALVIVYLTRTARHLPARTTRVFTTAFYASLVVVFVTSAFVSMVLFPEERARNFNDTKWSLNGPMRYLVHSIGNRLWLRHSPAVPDWAERFLHRPARAGISTYLSRIDQLKVKRRNVVVLLIESMRTDVLKAYGGDREVMPTVDRLAEKSMRFHNAYTQATHSNYADPVPFSSQYALRSQTPYIYPQVYTYPRVFIYGRFYKWII